MIKNIFQRTFAILLAASLATQPLYGIGNRYRDRYRDRDEDRVAAIEVGIPYPYPDIPFPDVLWGSQALAAQALPYPSAPRKEASAEDRIVSPPRELDRNRFASSEVGRIPLHYLSAALNRPDTEVSQTPPLKIIAMLTSHRASRMSSIREAFKRRKEWLPHARNWIDSNKSSSQKTDFIVRTTGSQLEIARRLADLMDAALSSDIESEQLITEPTRRDWLSAIGLAALTERFKGLVGQEMTRITVNLPEAQILTLQKIADTLGVSREAVIRVAFRDYLEGPRIRVHKDALEGIRQTKSVTEKTRPSKFEFKAPSEHREINAPEKPLVTAQSQVENLEGFQISGTARPAEHAAPHRRFVSEEFYRHFIFPPTHVSAQRLASASNDLDLRQSGIEKTDESDERRALIDLSSTQSKISFSMQYAYQNASTLFEDDWIRLLDGWIHDVERFIQDLQAYCAQINEEGKRVISDGITNAEQARIMLTRLHSFLSDMFSLPASREKELSLYVKYVNGVLKVYPKGKFLEESSSQRIDKHRDDQMCSLHPEVAVLWAMFKLGEDLTHEDYQSGRVPMSAALREFESNYAAQYNEHKGLEKFKMFLEDLDFDQANNYLISRRLQARIKVQKTFCFVEFMPDHNPPAAGASTSAPAVSSPGKTGSDTVPAEPSSEHPHGRGGAA